LSFIELFSLNDIWRTFPRFEKAIWKNCSESQSIEKGERKAVTVRKSFVTRTFLNCSHQNKWRGGGGDRNFFSHRTLFIETLQNPDIPIQSLSLTLCEQFRSWETRIGENMSNNRHIHPVFETNLHKSVSQSFREIDVTILCRPLCRKSLLILCA
jgi:hypothetical protein